MPAIEVSGLRKAYGNLEAVREVDFTIEEGEVFGLLGPNGAGKTTLLSVASGQLRPVDGRVLFDGTDVTAGSVERRAEDGVQFLRHVHEGSIIGKGRDVESKILTARAADSRLDFKMNLVQFTPRNLEIFRD